MKISLFRVGVALAFVAATAFPSAAADKEQRQMMADLRILQEQSQQLQNLVNLLSAALTDAIKTVNTRLDGQTEANRKAFADQKLVVDTSASDLRILREKVNDTGVRVGSLGQELDALRQAVAALNAPRPFGYDADNQAGGSTGGDTPAPPPTGAAGVGASPQKLWDGAMADYYAGQYDLAILGFDSYIKTFPQSPQAADAQIHIGISYGQQGKYDKAIEAYDAVIRTYPNSSVLPDAYVRKGTALFSLKQYDQAKDVLSYTVKNFADNVAATIAQQRLKDIQDIQSPKR